MIPVSETLGSPASIVGTAKKRREAFRWRSMSALVKTRTLSGFRARAARTTGLLLRETVGADLDMGTSRRVARSSRPAAQLANQRRRSDSSLPLVPGLRTAAVLVSPQRESLATPFSDAPARVLSIVRVDVAAQDRDAVHEEAQACPSLVGKDQTARLQNRLYGSRSRASGRCRHVAGFHEGYSDLIISREARVRPGELLGSGHR